MDIDRPIENKIPISSTKFSSSALLTKGIIEHLKGAKVGGIVKNFRVKIKI